MSDIQFEGQLEFEGELVDEISAEFTGNADQITFVPANNKTFYHIESKLYPVIGTVPVDFTNSQDIVRIARTDVEITYDDTLRGVLTHEFKSAVIDTGSGPGAAANTGQYVNNMSKSIDGNGIKAVKLTSTNNTGTYRVSMKGYLKDTGTSP